MTVMLICKISLSVSTLIKFGNLLGKVHIIILIVIICTSIITFFVDLISINKPALSVKTS